MDMRRRDFVKAGVAGLVFGNVSYQATKDVVLPRLDLDRLSTGYSKIDEFLGGGVKKGLSVLYGDRGQYSKFAGDVWQKSDKRKSICFWFAREYPEIYFDDNRYHFLFGANSDMITKYWGVAPQSFYFSNGVVCCSKLTKTNNIVSFTQNSFPI